MKKAVSICLKILLILVYFVFSFYPKAGAAADYYPGSDWRTSTPEEQGIDSEKLVQMLKYVKAENTDIDSILIIRHGYLVLESYIAPYDQNTIHNVKSVSKSILSALVGIALREKILTGVNQRVADIFPEYFTLSKDPRKKEITLYNLLTMTAGIDWGDDSTWYDRLGKNQNRIRAIIETPLKDNPGEKFSYNTASTHLMSGILTQCSGMSTRELARKYLFDSLGIDVRLWRQDPQGIYVGGAEIFLTPRDMAKFGYLYLKKGFWNGKEIVPSEWIDESTQFQVKTGGDQGISDDYGYWWWVFPGGYLAVGFGGQLIIVVPDQDLEVVVTSANVLQSFKIWNNYIKPALQPGKLEPNPNAATSLLQLIHDLEHPDSEPVSPVPEGAKQAIAKKFKLEKNGLGFTAFQLNTVNDKEYTVLVEKTGSKYELPVGLDGLYRIGNDNEPQAVFSGGVPVACKGKWLISSPAPTFVLEWFNIGEPTRLKAEITFAQKRVQMKITNKVTNQTININGKR